MKKPLILYYREGWRYGYLVKAGRKWTLVERILPAGSTQRKRIRVLKADTKAYEPPTPESSGRRRA